MNLQSVTKRPCSKLLMYDFYMKNRANILIFVMWFAISLFALFHHEIWRDEAQVWCLVRDLNFVDIYNATRVEGHPMLWYLLIMPFAKFGLPVESMQIISFVLVAASILFLLFKSPFTTLQKTLISLSAGMTYFLPAIARNYALIPLFIFLLANLYPKRSEKPWAYSLLLVFLSQTHVLMLVFCIMLFLMFALEKIKEKKDLPQLFLLFTNFVFLFFSFYRSTSDNIALVGYKDLERTFGELIFGFSYNFFGPYFANSMQFSCVLFYGILVLISYFFFKNDKKVFLIFLSSFLYMFYIFTDVWFSGSPYQKLFLLILILIFCMWVFEKKNIKWLKVSFNTLLAISVMYSFPAIYNEYKYNFSGAKQLVNYVKENLNNEKEFIVVGYPHVISPVSAYLPEKKFYSQKEKRYITYFHFESGLGNKIQEPKDIKYYIVQEKSYLFKEFGYNLIYQTDDFIIGPRVEAEAYKIYEKI